MPWSIDSREGKSRDIEEDKAVNTQEAFDTLFEALDDALVAAQKEGAEAMTQSDFSAAKDAAERGETIQQWMEALEKLHREWSQIFPLASDAGKSVPRGVSTPQKAFRTPILQVLVEMGGRGATADVLDRVGEMMEDRLKEIDRQILPSGRVIRWRNNAQWARNALVNEGLMASDSPYGVWEISEAGRAHLEERDLWSR
jgi:hypothetical protein